ncbi:RHS repeat-associated core domain-containing protein [Fodinibius roseus]|uniref:RHS repeat-associated core domain-containing protein n=1 Tax=Fodinibius roseus TaxID=1194090 RepID=A0A1M5CR61_9BACT|nr:SpvB/TcaC N-terminal domain-containing protein [Fodinibius roseus]SHF57127.1 RHS repeat-associated core domain-containing protein [Fodinibius roseus]
MGNNSSTPADVITTPRGGGALSGIGEKFSPDLFTGTGNFTIPIEVPPGRNEFHPELSLAYSTGNGNGPFGLGWKMSVPGVSRKTSRGVPVYDETEDTFILSGAEDLVAIEQLARQTRYRPRTEGLFARIIRHHDADSDYWEVRSKDGLASRYGTPVAAGEDPAVVADPVERSNVFSWKLTETMDPFGNRIVYEYERDAGREGPHHWDQLYLKRIRYADYSEEETTKFLAGVTFHYEERRDPFSQYRSGFEIRTRKRCTHIETHTEAEKRRLVRTYHLRYQQDSLNDVSLLNRIDVVGHDGDKTERLPPLEFSYSQFEPENRDFFPVDGEELPAESLGSPDLELADLSGNGLPDVLQMNGTVRYWRNLGGGRFDRPRRMDKAPAGLTLSDPGVQLIDADGDGRIDLMVDKDRQSGYYPLQPDGKWDRDSFQRYKQAPSVNLQGPDVKMVDLDGDGVTDAVRAGSSFDYFFNDPEKGWHEHRRVKRRPVKDFPDVTFTDARVRWADMTGDGLQDIVLIHDGNIEYWPNLGHGSWGKRSVMRNSPRFPFGYDPERILIGDVDGDGTADLIYVDNGKVSLWMNKSGNSWSEEPIEITGTPPISNQEDVRLADLLGNGISGLLWSGNAQGTGRDHLFFLDFTGGTKPYLLDEMDNNLGAITRVRYASSTRFYREDQQQPETRWKTTLPFPVQVVSQVEVIDELSGGKLTSEYRYHHGYWDGEEREFRGFGLVEQMDTEVFDDYNRSGMHGEHVDFNRVGAEEPQQFSPPTLKRTWFHQGPVRDASGDWEEVDYREEFWPEDSPMFDRPAAVTNFLKELPRRDRRDALRSLRGNKLRTELYALDGTERQPRPYTVTESLYGVREEEPTDGESTGRRRIFFPHKLADRTTRWERGDDPMTKVTFTEDYDEFGQSRRQTKIACPRGWRSPDATPGEPFLATRTTTEYAQRIDVDANIYIADRVSKTTTYEIENDGSQPLLELKALPVNDSALNVIGQKIHFYDGEAFEGLKLGQLGNFGALVRSKSLVLTDAILESAYRDASALPDDNGRPPCFTPGPPEWTSEYPQKYQEQLPKRAGYIYRDGSDSAEGYFAVTKQCKYDVQDEANNHPRGLRRAVRDPLGNETTIGYDAFDLLPVKVKDPAGLITKANYDYRTMQPRLVTGPNQNRTAFTFTPLGQLESKAVMGKEGEDTGDTPETPGTRLKYDFRAFIERGEPVSVRTTKRVHHARDTDTENPEETIETVEYSDGFGRLLQTRSRGEDVRFGDEAFGGGVLPRDQEDTQNMRKEVTGTRNDGPEHPNVVVSGWKIYDNKGRVVEQYEPFFSTGWAFIPPAETQFGQKVRKFYDPRGEVIRIVQPDGSKQRVIRGIPHDLTDPKSFEPSPWETYTYDANDNAGRTHGEESNSYHHHWDTPVSETVDALGRTVEVIERNRTLPENEDDPLPPMKEVRTQSIYDIRGNLLTTTDALAREAFRHVYDLADNPLRTESIDAGIRRMVLDAAGNEIERRDSKGALILQSYDHLQRPVHVWGRDGVDEPLTMRERLIYGDTPGAGSDEEALSANLLGKLVKHYDEAGLTTFERYDFKGNLLEKSRKVISDETILEVFTGDPDTAGQVETFRVDWQPPDEMGLTEYAGDLLDVTQYRTSTTYDALNRVQSMYYPEDAEGKRKKMQPKYNRAGALQQVTLDNELFVEHIAYDAKGQRTLMALGNGLMTRYTYDPKTFRLARLRTERYEKPDALTYKPDGAPLQDYAYDYDLAGNVTGIQNRRPDSGIPDTQDGADALDRIFTYDPLYRLTSATGRECDRPGNNPLWDAGPLCSDPTQVRAYEQQYAYDPAGNMKTLNHIAEGGRFTRQLDPEEENNRLSTLRIGNSDSERRYDYSYDACGNLIRENSERHFEWDHSNRMKAFRTQPGDAEPSVYVHYLYDAGGQRVKKLVRKQGGQVECRVYVDRAFEHHRWQQNGAGGENSRLHIMDGQKRIALLRVGDQHPDDKGPSLQYHLGDHLGSNNLVMNGDGSFISREEYTPYGETSFGSFAKKRYRFTGKERDPESGLYYHGARYYAPWLGRWMSCDPAGTVDGLNLYRYVRGNPLRLTDPNGTQSDDQPVYPGVKIDADGVSVGVQNVPPEQRDELSFSQSSESQEADSVDNLTEGLDIRISIQGRADEGSAEESFGQGASGGNINLTPGLLSKMGRGIKRQIFAAIFSTVFGGETPGAGKTAGADEMTHKSSRQLSAEGEEDRKARRQAERRGRRNPPPDTKKPKVYKPGSEQARILGEAKFGPASSGAASTTVKRAGQFVKKTPKWIPFLGTGAGIASAGLNLKEGNKGAAALDILGLIPLFGDALDLGRSMYSGLSDVNIGLPEERDTRFPKGRREYHPPASGGGFIPEW